ncbi:testis-specific Y-encoded-like protein 1 [Camelus ferus]|uniref:Testis-specific Y-encoded-like protein 1 n=1 Tax=Camelus ferus TaxID=419612 RepID=A0A8B8SMI6_CAMFR|nr:testis-specific Y-encoded-like protein 1 [Camelus ferus]
MQGRRPPWRQRAAQLPPGGWAGSWAERWGCGGQAAGRVPCRGGRGLAGSKFPRACGRRGGGGGRARGHAHAHAPQLPGGRAAGRRGRVTATPTPGRPKRRRQRRRAGTSAARPAPPATCCASTSRSLLLGLGSCGSQLRARATRPVRRGPGEGGPPQESWVALAVGGGLQEAGARGRPAAMAGLRTEQALAGGRCEEASSLRVEAVRQGASAAAEAAAAAAAAASTEAEVVGMGEALVLLADDIMEAVVEVVAEEQEEEESQEEEEEEEEEEGRAEPGRGPPTSLSPLEALGALQLELSAVNAQANRAYLRLKRRVRRRREPRLDRRRAIIQDIPGFWAKAIVSHPQLSALISDQDEDVLSYTITLEAQELGRPEYRCRLMFFFRSNPYFCNQVILKEYHLSFAGSMGW